MSIVYETILGKLGSRWSLNFKPRARRVALSPLGRFYDREFELAIGIQVGEEIRILPFSSEYPAFANVEQEITPVSVTYYAWEPSLGVRVEFEFISPFYPRDAKLSTAPLFYVEAKLENIGKPRLKGDAALTDQEKMLDGKLFLRLSGVGMEELQAQSSGFSFAMNCSVDPALAKLKWMDRTKGRAFSEGVFRGQVGVAALDPDAEVEPGRVTSTFSLRHKESVRFTSILAGYTGERVLQVGDEHFQFKYTESFADLQDVLRYGIAERDRLLKKSSMFSACITGASLDKSAASLIAFSMQSYLSNTWWMSDGRGKEWFSVWEGNCAYHSTIDVEYNTALFYLMLWPELLEMTFSEWTHYEKPGGYMSHDVGKFLSIQGMEYGHDMQVEENCNFILLLYALVKFTGNESLIEKYYEQVGRLTQYLIDSDTTGNGFPNTGTANTIDDAGTAVQYAKEQTYLGMKALSAFAAVREFARFRSDGALLRRCDERIGAIRTTLDRDAWLGDHYAVCLQVDASGLKDVWEGQALAGELPGWDAYSIYPSNGLLYLLMTGTPVPLDLERMKRDIASATEQSMTRYGCTHSSKDESGNLWISQNVWKDFTAAYLGLDLLGLADKYWDYELYENSQGHGGCFVDAPPRGHLNYYPRGVASIGLLYAMGGVQTDVTARTIRFNPVRLPLRIPLLPLADWNRASVPWAEFRLERGRVAFTLEHDGALDGYRIFVFDEEKE